MKLFDVSADDGKHIIPVFFNPGVDVLVENVLLKIYSNSKIYVDSTVYILSKKLQYTDVFKLYDEIE